MSQQHSFDQQDENDLGAENSVTPQPGPSSVSYFAAAGSSSPPYISPYPPSTETQAGAFTISVIRSQHTPPRPPTTLNPELRDLSFTDYPVRASMSTYSSSSASSSLYNSPNPQRYTGTIKMMSSPKQISTNEKQQLIRSLQTHRVNTLTELRRIEKIFATLNSADVTKPMTSAWAHYVNSNNLLSELRGLTKSYPFSSECLDEAKWQVIGDPTSTRSWNYCWLILTKIKSENLIQKHARLQAVKPAMWGGRTPTAAGVEKLATACVGEWTRALNQMLRHWDTPPSTTGR